MIDFKKSSSKGKITCDKCGNVQEYAVKDWAELTARARSEGWRMWKLKPVGKVWKHYCPFCAEIRQKNKAAKKQWEQQHLF